MKVKDLIKWLKEFDPEAIVIVMGDNEGNHPHRLAYEYDDSVKGHLYLYPEHEELEEVL